MIEYKTQPCIDQTREEIEFWLRQNAAVGLKVVIRSCAGGFFTYRLATVDRVHRGRLSLNKAGESGGSSFYLSGKNCFHPKGQTWLVMPTEATLAACDGPGQQPYSGLPK